MSVSQPDDAPRATTGDPRPQGERSRFYSSWRVLCAWVIKTFCRVECIDMHHVPPRGGVLIASNHQSFLDPPLLGSLVTWRQFSFMAHQYLFKVPVFGACIRALNAVPVSGSGSDLSTIKALIAKLKEGRPVVIFPEGSRTYDGSMQPFKRGVMLLIKRAKCPVVPIAIEGAFDAWPRHKKLPRLFGVRTVVVYGQPIAPDDLRDDQALLRLAQQIDELRLRARAILRERTQGRQPPPGPGDRPTEQLIEVAPD